MYDFHTIIQSLFHVFCVDLLCLVIYLFANSSNMKILLPIILFIVQISYVWTSKTEDTSSNHFDIVTTDATESDSIINYQARAARYHTGKPLLDALLFLPVTFAIFVTIKTIIVMVIIVAMIAPLVLCGPTDESCGIRYWEIVCSTTCRNRSYRD